LILDEVEKAQARTGESLATILRQLGLPRATYYRWLERAKAGTLADRVVVPCQHALPPTPEEVAAVRTFALRHPAMGYKRLAWFMIDRDVAYLRPYQVYRVLEEQDLLFRPRRPAPETLRRPPRPHYPDQVWHIDLMYVHIPPRWYYLVDILDGYSRFLAHWSLNMTMTADTVTLTMQVALDKLGHRHQSEPKIVHDHGSQFLSREWRLFVKAVGVTDIKTRVAHPQSNGLLERLHRTHREEGVIADDLRDYYQPWRPWRAGLITTTTSGHTRHRTVSAPRTTIAATLRPAWLSENTSYPARSKHAHSTGRPMHLIRSSMNPRLYNRSRVSFRRRQYTTYPSTTDWVTTWSTIRERSEKRPTDTTWLESPGPGRASVLRSL